ALLFSLGNFVGPGLVLSVVVIGKRQGLSAFSIGGLTALFGGCLVLGSVLSPLVRRWLPVRVILLLELWVTLSIGAFLIRPSVYVLVAGMCLWDLAIPSSDSVVHGFRIAMTPDRVVGRVESVRSTISLSIAPLGPSSLGSSSRRSPRARRSPS